MKSNKLPLVARLTLGLIFTVFGLNGFLGFIPMPPLNAQAGSFLGALVQSGYLFPLIKSLEIVSGIGLLLGFQVPLFLLILSPIAVNILGFHFFLTGPSTIGLPLLICALMIIVARAHWSHFKGVFAK